jgi:hypothetical protein
MPLLCVKKNIGIFIIMRLLKTCSAFSVSASECKEMDSVSVWQLFSVMCSWSPSRVTVTNSDMLQINELWKINQRPTAHFILNFCKPCFMDTFKFLQKADIFQYLENNSINFKLARVTHQLPLCLVLRKIPFNKIIEMQLFPGWFLSFLIYFTNFKK